MKQVGLLAKLGIAEMPASSAVAARMISFILRGNGAKNSPMTSHQRSAQLAAARAKYKGRQGVLRDAQGRRAVTVLEVCPWRPDEVSGYASVADHEVGAFGLVVTYLNETGKRHTLPIVFSSVRFSEEHTEAPAASGDESAGA